MSRSYKKHPVACDRNSKKAKKEANKKFRNTEEISNGSNYKKYYNSWDICDFRFWVSVGNKISDFWNNKKWFRK